MTCIAHNVAAKFGYLTFADVDAIQAVVTEWPDEKPLNIVDLGCGGGAATISCLSARAENIHVWGVEKNQHDSRYASLEVQQLGRRQDFTLHVGDAINPQRNPASVDFLIVDVSDKNLEEIIKAWLPRLEKENGRIWIGSVTEGSVVEKAVENLVKAGKIKGGSVGNGWVGGHGSGRRKATPKPRTGGIMPSSSEEEEPPSEPSATSSDAEPESDTTEAQGDGSA